VGPSNVHCTREFALLRLPCDRQDSCKESACRQAVRHHIARHTIPALQAIARASIDACSAALRRAASLRLPGAGQDQQQLPGQQCQQQSSSPAPIASRPASAVAGGDMQLKQQHRHSRWAAQARCTRRQCTSPCAGGAAAAPAEPADLCSACPSCAAVKPAKLDDRTTLRLALPSKGRMAEDTLQLLKARSRLLRCPVGGAIPHVLRLLQECPLLRQCVLPTSAVAGLSAERGEAQPPAVCGPHLTAARSGGLVSASNRWGLHTSAHCCIALQHLLHPDTSITPCSYYCHCCCVFRVSHGCALLHLLSPG
jgi:hypothetical protein